MATSYLPSSRLGLRIEQARWDFGLPDGARRLIASKDFEGRDNDSLVSWLATDKTLVKRLLRWCNTPLYNLSTPYKTLEEASKVMENQDMARLAFLAFVRGLFLPNLQIDIYQRETLWTHSIAVGAVSSLISRMCGCGDPSICFVAGTLHDIGLCASERLDPESFEEVVSQIDELSGTHEVEKDVLGWDHTQLGAAVLKQWGMPDAIQQAALHHHNPERALSDPHADTIGCVAIANYLCSRSGCSSTGYHSLTAPGNRVFQHLGIDSGLLTLLWQQLTPAFESVAQLR
ncbi:MAG: HDOD domain-containing protein [Rubripirellula sp.]